MALEPECMRLIPVWASAVPHIGCTTQPPNLPFAKSYLAKFSKTRHFWKHWRQESLMLWHHNHATSLNTQWRQKGLKGSGMALVPSAPRDWRAIAFGVQVVLYIFYGILVYIGHILVQKPHVPKDIPKNCSRTSPKIGLWATFWGDLSENCSIFVPKPRFCKLSFSAFLCLCRTVDSIGLRSAVDGNWEVSKKDWKRRELTTQK